MKISVVKDRVLVEPLEKKIISDGGIYIPECAVKQVVSGKVIAVGEDVKAPNLVEGSIVMFYEQAGVAFDVDGISYKVLPLGDVYVVLTEE